MNTQNFEALVEEYKKKLMDMHHMAVTKNGQPPAGSTYEGFEPEMFLEDMDEGFEPEMIREEAEEFPNIEDAMTEEPTDFEDG